MERVEYITELRKGNIPASVYIKCPNIAQIVEKLIVKNPDERPDTTMLLDTIKKTESKEMEQLKMQLAEKDIQISHLRQLLKSHGIKSV